MVVSFRFWSSTRELWVAWRVGWLFGWHCWQEEGSPIKRLCVMWKCKLNFGYQRTSDLIAVGKWNMSREYGTQGLIRTWGGQDWVLLQEICFFFLLLNRSSFVVVLDHWSQIRRRVLRGTLSMWKSRLLALRSHVQAAKVEFCTCKKDSVEFSTWSGSDWRVRPHAVHREGVKFSLNVLSSFHVIWIFHQAARQWWHRLWYATGTYFLVLNHMLRRLEIWLIAFRPHTFWFFIMVRYILLLNRIRILFRYLYKKKLSFK